MGAGHNGWARVVSVVETGYRDTVYNIEVADFHTYFVGSGGFFVHNTCADNTLDFAKKVGLNANSKTSQLLLKNRQTEVTRFISQHRKGSIREVFPSEFLQEGVTIEQALLQGGKTVRKLLTDKRFAK